MTIYQMRNTDSGDERITDGLSRKIDIEPCDGMTRKQWMSIVVRNLIIYGNAVIMPTYKDGLIENLIPLPGECVSFGIGPTVMDGYTIQYMGNTFKPSDVIHFVLNPDPNYLFIGKGYRIPLNRLTKTLDLTDSAISEYMAGRYMPTMIVRVDADSEELATPEGKRQVIKKYATSEKAGQPWVIPSELVDVSTVQPLTLNDIAVQEVSEMSKKAIASLMGVPSFVLGIGTFNDKEYNNFIKDKVLSIAKVIEQGLTKGLLLDPKRYFKFNPRSLYAYDIQVIETVGGALFDKGIMSGNEVRDWMGFTPKEGLDELKILENYIPGGMSGDQKKLNESNKSDESKSDESEPDNTGPDDTKKEGEKNG
jgi:HK97 family phage portal protein